MRYRVYFTGGMELDFSLEDHDRFISAIGDNLPGYDIRSFIGEHGTFFFNKAHYIFSDPVNDPEVLSSVITPPTPQQLKNEREQEDANKPVTLDDQLANKEVGA